jgi:pimeloyl-ACP methyl ester carboxylesterase
VRHLFALLPTSFALLPASGTERWEVLPPTPAPIPSARSGYIVANGISIYHAIYGEGPPVILLHGGLANADYWGLQVPALMAHHTVIVMDSRGHGRTTRDARPFNYNLMADDVVALMDALGLPKADIVGWSDGGTIGFDLAMRYPSRVGRIFAFAASVGSGSTRYATIMNPNVIGFIKRAREEYKAYSRTPEEFGSFLIQVVKMWTIHANWTQAQLQSISSPVEVVAADHDETTRRDHTEYIAATIPGARLLILPDTSHFAFLQAPELFNAAVLRFLGDA